MDLIMLIVLSFLFGIVKGYSTGAPQGECDMMIPGHGVSAQTVRSPYTIHLSARQYSCAGQLITVTINGTRPFMGFLCQPRPEVNSYTTYGSLAAARGTVMKNNCGKNAALTHNDSAPKSSVSFVWTAPAGKSDLQIVCTIVQTKNIFWVKTASAPISYMEGQCSGASKKKKFIRVPIYTLGAMFVLFNLLKD